MQLEYTTLMEVGQKMTPPTPPRQISWRNTRHIWTIGVAAVEYVHKMLNGANRANLPVQQAMKFDLVINLRTVKALVLTILPSILFQEDEVIR
jgi:hypothetical protein